MLILAQHTSPDGSLRLLVTRDDAGDTTIGFEGYSWHTHGDILARLSGLPEDEAIREYLEDVIADRVVIVVTRVAGRIRDVWPTDDPASELEDKLPQESLEFRRWSGASVAVSEA